MKRSRIVALTLVVAMIMMGTAYAAWTQTITVASTVETGELEVTITGAPGGQMGKITSDDSDYFSARGDFNKQYPEVDITDLAVGSLESFEELSSIVVSGVNFFPQTQYNVIFNLTNTGTIPADINFSSIDTTDAPFEMPTEDVVYEFIVYDYDQNLSGGDHYVISESGSDLKALIDGLEEYRLDPEDQVRVTVRMHFTHEADEDSLKENHDYGFGFDVNVTQFNIN